MAIHEVNGVNARKTALALGFSWCALYALLFLLRFIGLPPLGSATGIMILAGGPACLLLATLAGLRWERPAGAVLWMGAAVASMGLALESGPHVGRYFIGLALVVLPQAAVGSLFLAHAKARGAKPGARAR